MIKRRVEVVGESGDVLRELLLKSGEYVVEAQGVSVQVDPSRLSSKDSQGLASPKTIRVTPVSNLGEMLLCVLVESLHVALPLESALLSQDVLQKDLSPFRVVDALRNLFKGLWGSQVLNFEISYCLNVTS